MTQMLSLRRNASIRNAVAGVMCLTLIGVGAPNRSSASMVAFASPDIPTRRYVEIGNELFYVYSGVDQESGSFTAVIKKAVLRDTIGGPAFVLGQTPSADDVTVLGSDLYEAAMVTGTDLPLVQAWTEVGAWTITRRSGFTTASFRVGPDRFSMLLPQSVLDGKPVTGDTIDLEVNGFAVPLEPDTYARLLPGFRGERPDVDRLLSPLIEQFVDSGVFANSIVGAVLIAEKTVSLNPNHNSCAGECLGCVGTIALSVASYLAIGSTCAAAIATGGGLTPLCLSAILAYLGSSTVMFGTCATCGAMLATTTELQDTRDRC